MISVPTPIRTGARGVSAGIIRSDLEPCDSRPCTVSGCTTCRVTARFMKAHPHVKVHIGIVAFPLRRSNMAVIPWHQDKLVLVCAPATLRAAQSPPDGDRRQAVRRTSRTFGLRERSTQGILRAHSVAVETVMEFHNVETIERSIDRPETTGNEVRELSTRRRSVRP